MAAAGWATFEQMLKNYGLGDLVGWAKDQFTQGKTPDEISLALEDQPSFKRKYAAIFDRRAKGLPPVSVTDIMQYRQSAMNLEHLYDLPQGMLSDDQHVNTAISSDVSFDELKQRVTLGASIALNQPPEVAKWLQDNYGVGQGGLIAYFTDPVHAMPYIEKAAAAAQVAGAASRQGFGTLSRAEGEQLATAGVSQSQADQGFGVLSNAKQLLDPLAGSGEQAIGRDVQLGVVEGTAPAVAQLDAQRRRRQAAFKEGGQYAGGGLVSGTDKG